MTDLAGVADIARWLGDGPRDERYSPDLLSDLCERLKACGIPLWRVALFVRTLHPEIMGRRFLWQDGQGTKLTNAPFGVLEQEDFRLSPVAHVYVTGQKLRLRLAHDGQADGFPLAKELRAEGATDYIAMPLTFSNGEIHVVSLTTQHPGGFEEAQLAALETVAGPFARIVEIRALRRTGAILLDTYIGHQAGERILSGQIRRGHAESIRSAIWLSDMRGFTTLADRLPAMALIDLLNCYFDCQVPAIAEHGGEVLKFMGDGLLAIFPSPDEGQGITEACTRALAAARIAREKVGELARSGTVEGSAGLRLGLALHFGEVLYGNIGGGNRLDFTCIGPAVNLAARLEKLAGRLGRVIVASSEFAQHCPTAFEQLGEFSLSGFRTAETVYGLPNEA
jgi:adenylate cyclase